MEIIKIDRDVLEIIKIIIEQNAKIIIMNGQLLATLSNPMARIPPKKEAT